MPGIDADRERRAARRPVVGGHHRNAELVDAVFGEREADEAAAELRHEVHRFRRHEIGRHRQVAFVLAIFVVHHDDHSPGANLFERIGNREQAITGHEGASFATGRRDVA